MSHTLRMIPDAGCIEPFHIQRKQKPEGRILFTSGIKSHNCTLLCIQMYTISDNVVF